MIRVSQPLTDQAEIEALAQAMDLAYFGHGAKVVEFEKALQDYFGDPAYEVVCVSSGTAALQLALEALGIGPGDEVLAPSLTFVASFQAIGATGAAPVACDVREKDLLLDLADAHRRLTPRAKAVMPVHYAGNPGDLAELYAWAGERGLKVVEDAAHAFGGEHGGRKVGVTGEVACFSFDSLKNITCGEGGAVVCRDPEVARLVRIKRALGMDRKGATGAPGTSPYDVVTSGWRYHMSNLNAAMGLVQLGKAPEFIARRREIAKRYDQAFAALDGVATLSADYGQVAPFIHTIRVLDGRRPELQTHLGEREIESGVYYPACHLHSHYRVEGQSLPVSERLEQEILSLPLHCALSDDEVGVVIRALQEFSA
ncbi:MAG: DegT/DnrJ/EryC1/StrS family aminotransferase [Desulfarculaceae bacterium]|nr:DegT/DnrJ/EryC1/StrS family aminotransferase [Desulfarculaceae bacterium]MCF8074174.1 DegT/DnrJ/EryC1/StrS family aminotransferase [Desulfarculaceae bacterium]MCF8102755.1 DegT/DnrJ/EryC1/StrS family aminotransferase [Desulfarculaceae bacterium]MCF8116390.1 DegT/DnrJ/EryC1/StrS family aminotransferase [Desulfarculaceae bacterium]